MKLNKFKIGILALLMAVMALSVWAIELTPTAGINGAVGSGGTPGSPSGFKVESFLASGCTSFAITNNGSGLIVTNDFGITNLNLYKNVAPGSGFLSTATYVTNSQVSPFYASKYGSASIHQQYTAQPAWGDVPVWSDANGAQTANAVISCTMSGQAATTTNVNILYFVKSSDGQYYDTNQVFSFSVGPIPGTNSVTTNAVVTASFLTGARYIRLLYMTSGTNAVTTTNYISALSLCGTGK